MKRFFYTDPLAAAWQAKHHGMDIRLDKPDGKVFLETTLIHGLREWRDAISASTGYKFYVHPDSLPLLQPFVGDILRLYFYSPEEDDKHGAVMTGFYAGGREAIIWFRNPKDGGIEKQLHKIDDHKWAILQRNGIAFMSPESEDA